MYNDSLTSPHWMQIPTWIDRHPGITDKTKDYFAYDVRSSNFLARNETIPNVVEWFRRTGTTESVSTFSLNVDEDQIVEALRSVKP